MRRKKTRENTRTVGCGGAVWLFAALASLTVGCGRSPLDEPVSASSVADGGLLPVLPPTPGFLLCGAHICGASSEQCCLGVTTTGNISASCTRAGTACAGVSLQCDEPADCRGSNVCCFGLQSSSPSAIGAGTAIGSRCEARANCLGVGRTILCRTDDDCGADGGVCCPGIGVPTCQSRCLGN